MRPLSFEFPEDSDIMRYQADEESYMLGPSILIKPTRSEKLNEVPVYVPKGVWYDAFSMQSFTS